MRRMRRSTAPVTAFSTWHAGRVQCNAPPPQEPCLAVGHGATRGCRRRCRRFLLGCLGRLGGLQSLARVPPGLPGRPGRRLLAPRALLLALLPPERPLGLLGGLLQRLPRSSCRGLGLSPRLLLLGSRRGFVRLLALATPRAHSSMVEQSSGVSNRSAAAALGLTHWLSSPCRPPCSRPQEACQPLPGPWAVSCSLTEVNCAAEGAQRAAGTPCAATPVHGLPTAHSGRRLAPLAAGSPAEHLVGSAGGAIEEECCWRRGHGSIGRPCKVTNPAAAATVASEMLVV